MSPNTTRSFAENTWEAIERHGSSDQIISKVTENIHHILRYFFPKENNQYAPQNADELQQWIRIQCGKIWELFENVYPAIPDLFPERGIFLGVFGAPIGGKIGEDSAILRGKIFGEYLATNLDGEWRFMTRCYGENRKL